MGRHSTAPPDRPGLIRRTWRRLPEQFRARVWERRQRWRTFWDRRHTPAGEWDARLPNDPANWADDWLWGSVGVAAALRTRLRQRGALLPPHRNPPRTEKP